MRRVRFGEITSNVVEWDQIGDEGVPNWEEEGSAPSSSADVGFPSDSEDAIGSGREDESLDTGEVGGEDCTVEVEEPEKVPFEESVSPVAFHNDGVESVVPFDVLADDEFEPEVELAGPTLRLTVMP
jgi:hypothetical protein